MLASLLSLALIHSNCNFIRADNGWDFHKQQESVWTLRRGGVWLLQSFGRFEMWKWWLYRPAGGCPPSMKLKQDWQLFPCVATGWEKSHRPPVFAFYFGKCQMQSKRAVNTFLRHFIRFGFWFKWHLMNEHEKNKRLCWFVSRRNLTWPQL